MNVDEFLAWEERQGLRYEFDGSRSLAMVGGTAAHLVIRSNMIVSLIIRPRGTYGQAPRSHMKLRLAERVSGAAAMLRMPEIGVGLPLAAFYEGIPVEPDTDDAETATGL